MRCKPLGALICALVLGLVVVLRQEASEPKVEPEDKAEKHVKNLGDEDFEVREDAQGALEKMGVKAIRALEGALSSADPEVRRRSRRAYFKIVRHDAWKGTAVTIGSRKEKATLALREVCDRIGEPLVLATGEKSPADPELKLDLAGQPFWKAVGEICRTSGNHFEMSDGRLNLAKGSGKTVGFAHAGSLAATLVDPRYVPFSLDGKDVTSLDMNVHLFGEKKIRLQKRQNYVDFVSAVTSDGEKLGSLRELTRSMVGSREERTTDAGLLEILAPRGNPKALRSLTIKTKVEILGGLRTFTIVTLPTKGPVTRGALKVAVPDFSSRARGQWDAKVIVKGPGLLLDGHVVLTLTDSEGRKLYAEPFESVSAPGSLEIPVRFTGNGDATGFKLTVEIFVTSSQDEVTFEFSNVKLPVRENK